MKTTDNKINCIEVKIEYNSIYIIKSNNNQIIYDDDNINIINNILCGDPEKNFLLKVNDQQVNEVYIDSLIGNININYLKAKKVIINSKYGKILLKGNNVNIEKLIINSENGDVKIQDIHCKDISIKTTIGDVLINSNYIDKIDVFSQTGDLFINSTASKIYNTQIGDYKINNKALCLEY